MPGKRNDFHSLLQNILYVSKIYKSSKVKSSKVHPAGRSGQVKRGKLSVGPETVHKITAEKTGRESKTIMKYSKKGGTKWI